MPDSRVAPAIPGEPESDNPLFEILYPEGKSIRIYLDGHVDGADGAVGIVNHTSLLTSALWNAPCIHGETLRDRFRRVMALGSVISANPKRFEGRRLPALDGARLPL